MIGEIVGTIDWKYWRIQPVIDLSSKTYYRWRVSETRNILIVLEEPKDTVGRTEDTNVGNWRIQPVTLIDCSVIE